MGWQHRFILLWSGGSKSEIKVCLLAGAMFPLKVLEENLFQAFLLSFDVAGNPWYSLSYITPIIASVIT